jgi:hypothetical protein
VLGIAKMRPTEQTSSRLVARLNQRGLGGYLRVGQATPWANLDEPLAGADIDEMSPEAILSRPRLVDNDRTRRQEYDTKQKRNKNKKTRDKLPGTWSTRAPKTGVEPNEF